MKREIIYDMPSEEYHSLDRLSSSGIKKLLISSQDFWCSSWMNKNRKSIKSQAFNLGTAYHTRILEGKSEFDKRYAVAPNCDKRTKEGKLIYADWLFEHPDADPIDQEIIDDIESCVKRLSEIDDCFSGGSSEVSILWNDEETNVPMKARLDYKKPNLIPDLKTFSNTSGMDINRLLARHIVQYHYYIQAAVYREAVNEPEIDFNFVFCQTGGINNIIIKPFPHDLLLADKGRVLMRQGINKFRDMYLKYGDNPWYDDISNDSFKDEDFPMYALEG